MVHCCENKTLSYARQLTGFIAAMRCPGVQKYCSFFEHENNQHYTNYSYVEI